MLNATGCKDLILTAPELIAELLKPGKAYVWFNLTPDGGQWVEIVKSDLINYLRKAHATTGIECQVDPSGLYIGI
jgi:hypothetical protein